MNKRQTILIAEDSKTNRIILTRMLQKEYDTILAENGQEAIELLSANIESVSAILLDIMMPVKNGYEVLDYIRKNHLLNIPVIVMTGETDEESEERTLDLGAWDFVPKPYKPKVLFTRLRNAIARSKMNYLAQVRHIAEHDQLTDLYNRRHFFENTENLLKNHVGEEAAFIRMDIDRFRLINAFLGEAGGDQLLKYIAEELEKVLESYPWCTYGRIESDIFGFCVPYEKERCEKDLKYLRERINEFNRAYLIEPSFGIYCMTELNQSIESIYVGASLAAKKCKDQFQVYINYYDSKMSENMRDENMITQEMQKALEREEFLVYFQPKYNTQTKSPYGAEALVRWNHPERGMISPGVFIPIFEKNGFIGNLDYYVWEKVCQYLKKWQEEGINPAPVSVNVSRAELSNPNVAEMIIQLVEKYQIAPKILNLELTESAYMDNPEAMNHVIDRLHEAGFTILIDDFGSGYSSLNTLKDIEVDILKVDMKFLASDSSNVKSKKILSSVITMSQWLGLPVITEGVETEEQYQFLQSIGCEYIQGYYFAKPMPVEEYEVLIRNTKPIEAKYRSREQEYMVPQQAKEKIYRDDLTHTYSRRYLKEWLLLDIEGDDKREFSLAVILVELKFFKQVNEKHGYLTGEEVLQQVAGILLANTRKKDAVIRYGEDEFLMVLSKCEEAVVQKKILELQGKIQRIAEEQKMSFRADFGYSYREAFERKEQILKDMIEAAYRMKYQNKQRENRES